MEARRAREERQQRPAAPRGRGPRGRWKGWRGPEPHRGRMARRGHRGRQMGTPPLARRPYYAWVAGSQVPRAAPRDFFFFFRGSERTWPFARACHAPLGKG
eukprot:9468139-Pyramimonas_sp.AAC.1